MGHALGGRSTLLWPRVLRLLGKQHPTASNSTQLGPSGDKFSFFFLRKGMGGPGTTPVLGDEGEAHSLKQKKREGRFSFHSLSSSFS